MFRRVEQEMGYVSLVGCQDSGGDDQSSEMRYMLILRTKSLKSSFACEELHCRGSLNMLD